MMFAKKAIRLNFLNLSEVNYFLAVADLVGDLTDGYRRTHRSESFLWGPVPRRMLR